MKPAQRLFSSLFLIALVGLFQGCASRTTVAYVANADSRDISVLQLDRDKGSLQTLQTVAVGGTVMPMAVSPDKRHLYAALRSEPFTVVAFAIDARTGQLTRAGSAPLPDSMANIATDRTGRWLFAASYGGNRISVSPIAAHGVPGPAVSVIPTGKNAHAAVMDAANKNLFVTNLGSDQVLQFRFDAASGQLTPNAVPAFATRAGAGPRHLVFHPSGRRAYLLHELDATLDILSVDPERGTLGLVKTVPTLPPGFTGKPWAADLHLTPDGRFLYTSERNSNTLAMWRIDAATGDAQLIGHVPTEKQPRGFHIDPTGQWLLAVGQLSNAMTAYRIDKATGVLTTQSGTALGKGPNWVEIIELP
ncbi:MAG: beta-propeller fold lactonase family protein [Burkholderiaceae bacterium]